MTCLEDIPAEKLGLPGLLLPRIVFKLLQSKFHSMSVELSPKCVFVMIACGLVIKRAFLAPSVKYANHNTTQPRIISLFHVSIRPASSAPLRSLPLPKFGCTVCLFVLFTSHIIQLISNRLTLSSRGTRVSDNGSSTP